MSNDGHAAHWDDLLMDGNLIIDYHKKFVYCIETNKSSVDAQLPVILFVMNAWVWRSCIQNNEVPGNMESSCQNIGIILSTWRVFQRPSYRLEVVFPSRCRLEFETHFYSFQSLHTIESIIHNWDISKMERYQGMKELQQDVARGLLSCSQAPKMELFLQLAWSSMNSGSLGISEQQFLQTNLILVTIFLRHRYDVSWPRYILSVSVFLSCFFPLKSVSIMLFRLLGCLSV